MGMMKEEEEENRGVVGYPFQNFISERDLHSPSLPLRLITPHPESKIKYDAYSIFSILLLCISVNSS